MNRLMIASLVLFAGCRSAPREHHPEVILAPDAGDRLWFFHQHRDDIGSGGEMQIFVDSKTFPHATAGMAKYTLGVGGATPIHRHDRTEEFVYILSGDGAAVVVNDAGEEVEKPLKAGYVWYSPPGGWHAIRNKGGVPLVLVLTAVPNDREGLLTFFRRVGVKPGDEPVALEPEQLRQLAAECDIILWDERAHGHTHE